jgi:predicted dehydrogenase
MGDGKLGICIVGCGDLGSKHAERWAKLPDVKIAAVCDLLPERGLKARNLYSLDRWYADYHEAVRLPEVDVVSVAIPTALHADASIAAMEAGKHVLCEKPIALKPADAESMIATAKKQKVKFTVGLMRLYSPVTKRLRDFLGNGELGRPVMYTASDVREVRPKIAMHDRSLNAGPVVDQSVHQYSLWAYVFDSRPVEVYARALTIARGRPELKSIKDQAVDTALISIRYESGDLANFNVCWGLPPRVNPAPFSDRILGPRGLVEYSYSFCSEQLVVWREGNVSEVLADSTEDLYQLEINSFYRTITRGEPLAVPPELGRDALIVAEAAFRSIETGAVVAL